MTDVFIKKGISDTQRIAGDTHGGERPCEGAMKGAICKPRTEPSGGTKPRDAWLLAFQPPELGENEILPSKPLGLWYSVVAALAI